MAPEALSSHPTGSNGTSTSQQHQQFTGKTAIVTGASRGIGAGIAVLLGARGANVVVNYTSAKSEERGLKVVKAIQASSSGAKGRAVQADVTTAAGQQSLIDAALELSSSRNIDILVHNAGDGTDAYLKDVTEQFYYQQTDLNIKGTVR